MSNRLPVITAFSLAVLLSLALTSCRSTGTPAAVKPSAPATAQASPTIPAPTPTPPPLAAEVDGEWVLLSDFEAEMQRYADANAQNALAVDAQQKVVLDELINTQLLAGAAIKEGASIDDAALQARMDALSTQLGGMPALTDWMARNHYTDDSFRRTLKMNMLAAQERDKIIASVPTKADQVHARQILVQDSALAENLETKLKGGVDFATLALQYDPLTGGELGWFPTGFLTQPEVEKAAFGLQPGQYSTVIQSALGYHIVFVIERDPQRPLNPDALRTVQEKALRDWLEQHRAGSKIQVFLQ